MTKSSPVVRQATGEDIVNFYGRRSNSSVRAWAVECYGALVAISGVALEPHGAVFFSDIREDITVPKMGIWRAAWEIVEHVRALGLNAHAIADSKKPSAGKFLLSLGFSHESRSPVGDVYRLLK